MKKITLNILILFTFLVIGQNTLYTMQKTSKKSTCDVCFKNVTDLTRHLKTHSGEKLYKCTMCDKAFNDFSNLTRHLKTHSGEKPYKCTMCDRAFNDFSTLTRHLKTHSGEKPYKCTMCDRAFKDFRNLTRHLKTHSGEKPYKCTMCDRAFNDSSNYKAHLKRSLEKGCNIYNRAKNIISSPIEDENCSQSPLFSMKRKFEQMDTPIQRTVTCSECGEKFKSDWHLSRHIKVHPDPHPECDLCGNAFTPNGLECHQNLHYTKENFPCFLCDKIFLKEPLLTKHEKEIHATTLQFLDGSLIFVTSKLKVEPSPLPVIKKDPLPFITESFITIPHGDCKIAFALSYKETPKTSSLNRRRKIPVSDPQITNDFLKANSANNNSLMEWKEYL